jgi:putative protein-disulfide isomerase
MSKFLFTAMALLLSTLCMAQDKCTIKPVALKPSNNLERQSLVGQRFPAITVKNLQNVLLSLPLLDTKKPSVVCILFTDQGRPVANPWTEHLLKTYPAQEINLIELAMLNGSIKILRKTIEQGMRNEVDTSFHKNYTTYFGPTKSYKRNLIMPDKNSCYLFLLDEKGIIQYTSDGYINANKTALLQHQISEIKAIYSNPNYTPAKDTIRLVVDPLCGFCYAFEPEMQKIVAAKKDKFVFDIISGGMIIGEQEGPISKVAPHIAYGYKDLEKMSSSKFGTPFLNGILKEGTYKMSSELPSIAIAVFKSLQPEQAIAFASDVQTLFYFEGISLNEPNNYRSLVQKYGVNADDFIKKLTSEEWKIKTYKQFEQAKKSGVEGYPSLILIQNGIEQVLTSGFVSYEELIKRYPFK